MERVALGMHVKTPLPMDEAEQALREEFKAEGFGVLTEVDVQATLKEKIGADTEPYRILGFCNPGLAHRALQIWKGFGLIAPCHVALYDVDDHRAVQALDPLELQEVHEDPELLEIAREARAGMERALQRFEQRSPA